MAGIGSNIFGSAGLSVNASTDSAALATATYGPPDAGSVSPFSPKHGHGLGFWIAVGGVIVLVFVRQSLPR